MTPKRFRTCLDIIGWSILGMANRLGVSEQRARRWMAGDYPMPDSVAEWLEALAAAHRNNPPPKQI